MKLSVIATPRLWALTPISSLDRIVSSANAYRPVVVMHGILSSYDSMTDMVQFIQKAHPGTEVLNVDAFNDAVRLFNNLHIKRNPKGN